MTTALKLTSETTSLDSLTTVQLREELFKCMKITAEQLVRMAAIVRLLEERGEDLSDIRMGMLNYIRKIACGQLLPEVVVKFQGHPRLLSRVSALPIPDQKKAMEDKPLRVMFLSAEGESDARTIEPMQMNSQEIGQVFAKDHIRTDAEQVSFLRAKTPPVNRAPDPIQTDRKRGGIVVTGDKVFISKSRLLTILAQMEMHEKRA